MSTGSFKSTHHFVPVAGKDMRQLYKEIDATEEYDSLSEKELKFVWAIANPTSPFVKRGLIGNALLIASLKYAGLYEILKNKGDNTLQKYLSGDIPDNIVKAIDKMKSYDVPKRVDALSMQEKIFQNYKKIVELDINEVPFEKRNAYVAMSKEISAQLPTLIAEIESRYGLSVKLSKLESRDIKNTLKHIDRILDSPDFLEGIDV